MNLRVHGAGVGRTASERVPSLWAANTSPALRGTLWRILDCRRSTPYRYVPGARLSRGRPSFRRRDRFGSWVCRSSSWLLRVCLLLLTHIYRCPCASVCYQYVSGDRVGWFQSYELWAVSFLRRADVAPQEGGMEEATARTNATAEFAGKRFGRLRLGGQRRDPSTARRDGAATLRSGRRFWEGLEENKGAVWGERFGRLRLGGQRRDPSTARRDGAATLRSG